MTAQKAPLAPGRRLGEWLLEAPLGRGGQAEVWRARHNAFSDRVAALKVPHDPALADALKAEGRLQRAVSGPHIVGVQGLDPDHDPPYLVTDLIEGESLRARLERGRLDVGEALRLLREVALALEVAHRAGVVHRDLKPENVLLDRSGTAWVSDFGLGVVVADATARLLASGSLRSATGADLAGTIRYMAPEQRDPDATVDARADLYACGVILFELLTGEAPGGGEVPSDVVPGLDPHLDQLYRHLCARLPSRCESATALLAELDRLRAAPPGTPPDPSLALAARPVDVPAGLTVRALAALLDALPFALLTVWPLRSGRAVPFLLLGWILLDVLATSVSGRTPGKALLGLVVRSKDGGPADGSQLALREAWRAAALLTFGLGWLLALRADKRALHDLLAGTCVVHDSGHGRRIASEGGAPRRPSEAIHSA